MIRESDLRRWHVRALANLGMLRAAGRLASAVRLDAPGVYRSSAVVIRGARHQPPHADRVADETRELLALLSARWHDTQPVILAGLALWRINWIHPFRDGNGRVARAAAQAVLERHGILPAGASLEAAILADRAAYLRALRAADASHELDSDPLRAAACTQDYLQTLVGRAGHREPASKIAR